MIEILKAADDKVVNAKMYCGCTTYKFATENLYPLINKLNIQRNVLDPKFYSRLEMDLIKGCIMPPITIAFVAPVKPTTGRIEQWIVKNISSAFILDGIQRLNTLHKVISKKDGVSIHNSLMFVNILICPSRDNLLYRMVTLNNGQKPMPIKHQIEILADNVFDFSKSSLLIQSAKEKKGVRQTESFSKADMIKGYIAFMSGSIAFDNQKIIEERMDDILAERIIRTEKRTTGVEFQDLLDYIEVYKANEKIMKWFRNGNNLIGFAVGAKQSFSAIRKEKPEILEAELDRIDRLVDSWNKGSVKLGQLRRKTAEAYFTNYTSYKKLSENQVLEKLMAID